MEQKDSIFRNDLALFVVEEANNDFVYRYVNKFYSQIMNLEYPLQKYYKASKIMGREDFTEFMTNFKNLKNEYDHIRYEKIYHIGQLHVPISITMFLFKINNRVLIACTASNNELYLYEFQHKRKNASPTLKYYTDSLYSTFSLKLSQSYQCMILDLNKVFSSYIGIEVSQTKSFNLKTILPKKVANFLSQGLIASLRKGHPTNLQLLYECNQSDLDNYYCPDNGCFYLNVTFAPMTHVSPFTCYCFARDISEEIFIQRTNEDLILEYETIFNTSIDAIAILKVLNNNIIQLEKQNKRMEVFLNRFPELLPRLLEKHNNFNELIIEKSRIESNLSFVIHDETYDIQVNVVPIIKSLKVDKIAITILNINSNIKTNISNRIHVHLTKREREIIFYVTQGRKNDYIATKLGISTGTVKKTLSNVYKKLSITSRVELIQYYMNEQA